MNKRRILELGGSAAIVTSLAYFADLGTIYSTVLDASLPLYAGAIFLFLLTYPISGLRWKKLSKSTGHEISFQDAVRVVAVSYGFNKVLPWNSGDIARSKISESYHEVESHGQIFGSAGFERFLDATAIISVIAVSAAFTTFQSGLLPVIAAFALLFLGGGAIVYRTDPHSLERKLPEAVSGFSSEVFEGFRSIERDKLGAVLVLSQAKWWTEAVVFYLLAGSISAGIGFWDAALVTSVISIISALPISPAGIGPGDAVATGMLTYAGMGYSGALSLVILQRSVGVGVQGVVGAAVYAFDL